MIQVKLKKIEHRGDFKIALYFDRDPNFQKRVQEIGGRWSKTHACWYTPYTKEHYNLIKTLDCELILPENLNQEKTQVAGDEFREIPPIVAQNSNAPQRLAPEWDRDNTVHKPENKKVETFPDLKYVGEVGRYWAFKLHYRQNLVRELKKVKGLYWNPTHKCYMAYQNEKIRKQIHQILDVGDFLPPPRPNDDFKKMQGAEYSLKSCVQNPAYVEVHLPKIAKVIEQVKRISYSKYYKPSDCYWIPAAPKVIDSLKEILGSMGLQCINLLPDHYLSSKHMPRKKHMELTASKNQVLKEVPEYARQYLHDFLNRLLAKGHKGMILMPFSLANSTIFISRFLPTLCPLSESSTSVWSIIILSVPTQV